jgi:hypothetical protein
MPARSPSKSGFCPGRDRLVSSTLSFSEALVIWSMPATGDRAADQGHGSPWTRFKGLAPDTRMKAASPKEESNVVTCRSGPKEKRFRSQNEPENRSLSSRA